MPPACRPATNHDGLSCRKLADSLDASHVRTHPPVPAGRPAFAIAEHPHPAAIRDGSLRIVGVDARFVTVQPQISAFRRMVRDVGFDVCETAPTIYIIARAFSRPFSPVRFPASVFPTTFPLLHMEAGKWW